MCSFAALLASPAAYAENGIWDGGGKNFIWGGIENWNPRGAVANGAGSTAFFTYQLTSAQAISINTARTVGSITFTDTTSSHDLTLEKSKNGHILTLDNKGLPPVITVTQADRNLSITAQIAGQAGLTKAGPGMLTLFDENPYSGETQVKDGTLKVVAGGSCKKSPLVLLNPNSTHCVLIGDNTKSWTYASLWTKSAAALEFDFGATPSTTVAPLFLQGAATFTGNPKLVIKGKLTAGTFPLMTWDSISGAPPNLVKMPDGFTGSLKLTDYALFLVVTKTAAK